jgi:hypothetical protein
LGIIVLTACLDHDDRGIVVKDLLMGKLLPNAIVDVIVQTTRHGENIERGRHYHPKCALKDEIFVPLTGEAYLQWHEASDPKANEIVVMRPIIQEAKAYRVEPDTCHRVVARTESFLMLSLNNTLFRDGDTEKCEHGFPAIPDS